MCSFHLLNLIFWISIADVPLFRLIAKGYFDVLQVIELIRFSDVHCDAVLSAVLSDNAFAHLVFRGIVPHRAVPREGWCLLFLSLPAEDQPPSEPCCLY